MSEESKAAIGAAGAPPIKLVTIGVGEDKHEIGNETVLFRHEQKFHHPAGIAIEIESTLSDDEIKSKVEKVNNLKFERVAQLIKVNIIAIKDINNDPLKFENAVKIVNQNTSLPIVLISDNLDSISKALAICKDKKPLIYGATKDNFEKMANIAKESGCPLAIKGNLEEISEMTSKVCSLGVQDLILAPSQEEFLHILTDLVQIRRLALKKNFRALGYPVIVNVSSDNAYEELSKASICLCKYAGIIIMKNVFSEEMLSLLTLRQNIYTDPQKPIQIEAKIYEVGNVSPASPVLITTNFSLTYFTVEAEVESSRVPSYIVSVDTEGTSVLTAWAADKFNAEKITAAMKKFDIASKVNHKKIIIPGGVAVLSGKLQEESGCEVLVGPREASGITQFLRGLQN
jgi:acetyl-CoA decarbonylase/synthase complex subunit gamma